jgi:hypothetical protein
VAELEAIREAESAAARRQAEWKAKAREVHALVVAVVDEINKALELPADEALRVRYELHVAYEGVPHIQVDLPSGFTGLATVTEGEGRHLVRSVGARLVIAPRPSGLVRAVYVPGRLDDPKTPPRGEMTVLDVHEPNAIGAAEVREAVYGLLSHARADHWTVHIAT